MNLIRKQLLEFDNVANDQRKVIYQQRTELMSLDDISETINIADKVLRRFEFEKSQYVEITNKLKTNEELFESIPAIIPCEGKYSSESFGMRLHPILHVVKMHGGIDIITNIGTNVKSTGKGKVVFVGRNAGYGLAVEIDHGFGYRSVYGHLSSTKVKEGQLVSRGQIIAKSGNSGLSSGPHLHYEITLDNKPINPYTFMQVASLSEPPTSSPEKEK